MSNNAIQIRVNAGDGVLHLQGSGKVTANREYGYAEKFTVPNEMTEWLSLREPTNKSFASKEMYYIRGVTLSQYNDCVALEIKDKDGEFVLHLNSDSPKCAALIDFALQNDLLQVYDEPYNGGEEE